ncbi:MAG: PorT family protein [Dysgonamonadaceae bacterium]|jgi:hypothetical protein|nr:PorT family protein [Dysgonamonadaceae bacterium]
MRNFKALILVAMFAVSAMVSAQSFSYGITAGVGVSNLSGDVKSVKAKIGFKAGVFGDFEFSPEMSIQTGLFYVTKGAKFDWGEGKEVVNPSFNFGYLQLPVHYASKIEVVPGTKVVLHVGPYVAYGLDGKVTGKEDGVSISVDLYNPPTGSYFFGGKKLNRFDAGLGLGAGAEFGSIIVDLGWDYGLLNMSPINNTKIKNQSGYLTVGYKF